MSINLISSSREKRHVLDLLLLLLRRRRAIAYTTIGATLLTLIIVFVVPATYTSTTIILPPQQSSSLSTALLGQLGMLSNLGVGGMDSGFSPRSPQDTYIGILSSRTVADELIEKFNLAKVYHTSNPISTWKALARHTHMEATRGFLIRVSVEDHDPQRAADMANTYADSLYKQIRRLALTQASQKRVFFEEQLADEKPLLNQAEEAMEQNQEKTGIFEINSQTALALRSIAQLSAEITSREVQLQGLRSVATGENNTVQTLQSQIAALRSERDKLEKGNSTALSDNALVPTAKAPQASLNYLRKMRDLHYHEALNELLSKQYEMARVEEAKDPPLLQIVDRAIPIRKKTWPPRALLTLVSFVLFFFVSCGWAVLWESWKEAAGTPENAARISQIRAELKATHPS
jgi:uncharacterized protein involved in exopolysaccharide biosynthesis